MVADHQGGQYQGGMNQSVSMVFGFRRPMPASGQAPLWPRAVHFRSFPISGHCLVPLPDVYDGTSAVRKADTAFQGASVGQPAEPCLADRPIVACLQSRSGRVLTLMAYRLVGAG